MQNMSSKQSKVASYWDKHRGRYHGNFSHWESSPPAVEYTNKTVTGNVNLKPLRWFWERYSPFSSVANVCCGIGNIERIICEAFNYEGDITGYDISTNSLSRAREQCADYPNVNFMESDLNTMQWPENTYDLVMANGALHHIENLDFLLGQINKAMKSNTILYVNDYVGPNRFQWSDVQMRYANDLLNMHIPEKYLVKKFVSCCDAAKLSEKDPSEAVCSMFIEDAINAHFDVLERKERGGTVLSPIFGSNCIDQSILDDEEGMQALSALCNAEGELIREGILRSNTVIVIAKPR